MQDLSRTEAGSPAAEGKALPVAPPVLEAALDPIIAMDHRGNVVEFNPAAERTFGYRRADVLGRPLAEFIIPPALREHHRRGLARYLATGAARILNRRLEVTAMRADGSEFPAELAVTLLPGSGAPVFTAHLRDLSERKRHEALVEEQARLAAFGRDVGLALNRGDAIPQMLRHCCEAMVGYLRGAFARIWTLDEAGDVLELQASAGLYTHTDGPHGRVPVGKFKIGLIAQERQPHLTNQVIGDPRVGDPEWAKREGMVAFAGYPLLVEDRVVGVMAMFARRPLSQATLEAMASVANGIALGIERKRADEALRRAREELEARVRERTSELDAVVAALRHEIQERREAEERARAFAAELQRSNDELQQFASVASHDLQEPLRKIQAFGDRLKSRYAGALDETGRDYIARMQNAAARMSVLINDLLAFSRVTTRAQPFAPVDLGRVAADVLNDLESRIQQTGARVEVGPLPTIDADPLQMRQLFQNLIGNALKFHKPDVPPEVSLSAEPVESNGKCCWRLAVSDDGIGFDEKYLDRIFEVFQRLHARSEYEGTGMGLAICRKIVERHGGSITARSAPGAGSTFLVTLPAEQADERVPSSEFQVPS